jgi:STE24 endopeptidase
VNENKATRYHRLKRRARVAGLLLGSSALVGLVLSGGAIRLRDGAEAVARAVPLAPGWEPWVVVALFVTVLVLLAETIAFPLAAYRGYLLERRYGLGTETFAHWMRDHLKTVGLGLLFGIVAAQAVYWALREYPAWWWLLAPGMSSVFSVLLAWAAPVLLFPLFYRVVPLQREALRERLLRIARQAGTRVLGAYEWKLGERSRAANAALVGIGPTRRILLSDTLLAEYTDDEIEVILAHELAHHVHGDIRNGLLLDAVLTLATLLVLHGALWLAWEPLGFRGPADVAGLPFLLMVGGLWSLSFVPLLNAMSRSHERRADRFALDLTRNPAAFISAMKRLGQQNLADEWPSRLSEVLFHSHPPLPQRIAAARAWMPDDGRQSVA